MQGGHTGSGTEVPQRVPRAEPDTGSGQNPSAADKRTPLAIAKILGNPANGGPKFNNHNWQ